MELTNEQAFGNIVAVVKQFRGLTIDEAKVIELSLSKIEALVKTFEEKDNG